MRCRFSLQHRVTLFLLYNDICGEFWTHILGMCLHLLSQIRQIWKPLIYLDGTLYSYNDEYFLRACIKCLVYSHASLNDGDTF